MIACGICHGIESRQDRSVIIKHVSVVPMWREKAEATAEFVIGAVLCLRVSSKNSASHSEGVLPPSIYGNRACLAKDATSRRFLCCMR